MLSKALLRSGSDFSTAAVKISSELACHSGGELPGNGGEKIVVADAGFFEQGDGFEKAGFGEAL